MPSKIRIGVGLLMAAVCKCQAYGDSVEPVRKAADEHKPDVMVVYYPHWHRYPKGDEWFGEKWKAGEWAFATRRTAKGPDACRHVLREVRGTVQGQGRVLPCRNSRGLSVLPRREGNSGLTEATFDF